LDQCCLILLLLLLLLLLVQVPAAQQGPEGVWGHLPQGGAAV
jgi:hypothetical protein